MVFGLLHGSFECMNYDSIIIMNYDYNNLVQKEKMVCFCHGTHHPLVPRQPGGVKWPARLQPRAFQS